MMRKETKEEAAESVQAGRAARRRKMRAGGYATMVAALTIAVAVAANLMVSNLPASMTKWDMTENGVYTLSEQSEEVAAGLDKEVTIYHIAQKGAEDSILVKFLDQYSALSPNIKVKTIDPDVYPNFASQYTQEQLYNNSLIVVCGDNSRYVSYYDIFKTTYTSYYSASTDFDGEGALTSAVAYVTSENLPKVYVLSGHGEPGLPDAITHALEQQNLTVESSLVLMSQESVPEDADAVIIYAPQSDLSQEDAQKLKDYIAAGGKILLATNDTGEEMPNLQSVTEEFGLSAKPGMVFDGDASYAATYPMYLLPEMLQHDITSPLIEGGYVVLAPAAHALETAETLPEGVTVTPLLSTSDQGYNKADSLTIETLEKEEGDETGTFDIAAAAEKTVSDEENAELARLVWFGAAQMLDTQVDAMTAGANSDLVVNAAAWLCDKQDSISIHAKSLDMEYLTVPAGARAVLSAVTIVVIPAAFLIAGILGWKRRKSR